MWSKFDAKEKLAFMIKTDFWLDFRFSRTNVYNFGLDVS